MARQRHTHQERRLAHARHLAVGTLACPACDAPVVPGAPLRPAEALSCPYCDHLAAVREFLSLGEPTRPTRVVVRVGSAALGPARLPAGDDGDRGLGGPGAA